MRTGFTGSDSSAVLGLGLKELRIAPHTPWQSPYVERLIGSLRRECLGHVIVFNPTHLRGVLAYGLKRHPRCQNHYEPGAKIERQRPLFVATTPDLSACTE
jgi:putative transposase